MTGASSAPVSTGRSRGAVTLRLATLGVSGALLYVLYDSMDIRGIGRVLREADAVWLAVSLGMLIPITVMRASRFRWLAPTGSVPGLGDAVRITLVASAVNVFLPAKAGDFAKSLIITRRDAVTIGVSSAVVVFERMLDVVGLVTWCLAGYLLVRPVAPLLPPATWLSLAAIGSVVVTMLVSTTVSTWLAGYAARTLPHGRASFLADLSAGWAGLVSRFRGRRYRLIAYSMGLWFVQLLQIWLFTVVVAAHVRPEVSATLSAIALLVGQLPVTFGGIGARDVALVLLFSPYMTAEQAAAVGILTASRNLLPPLAALPFLRRYASLIIPASQSPS